MKHWIVPATARPVGRALATVAATTLSLFIVAAASAQAPAPAPKPPAAKPPAAKPPAAPAGAPAAKPPAAAAPAAPQPAAAAPQSPPAPQIQLIYSPWTKFCPKNPDANAKQVCFTGKEGRIESGMLAVSAVLIEADGEPNKILSVTVPLGMSLPHGTRVFIDQSDPLSIPYGTCIMVGCVSQTQASPDFIKRLEKGQSLFVQAMQGNGQTITLGVPLGAEFAKAHEGPPMDPKVFEEQQKKLQDELQRRADEARKKLEQQGAVQPGK